MVTAAHVASSDVHFVVGPTELKFALGLHGDTKDQAGFKAWAVSADAEGGVT